MKKVLILALALILLLGIAARGTFGLFSDTETSTGNTFTAWVEEVVCVKFNVSDKPAKLLAILSPCVGEGGYELVEVFDQEPWKSLHA